MATYVRQLLLLSAHHHPFQHFFCSPQFFALFFCVTLGLLVVNAAGTPAALPWSSSDPLRSGSAQLQPITSAVLRDEAKARYSLSDNHDDLAIPLAAIVVICVVGGFLCGAAVTLCIVCCCLRCSCCAYAKAQKRAAAITATELRARDNSTALCNDWPTESTAVEELTSPSRRYPPGKAPLSLATAEYGSFFLPKDPAERQPVPAEEETHRSAPVRRAGDAAALPTSSAAAPQVESGNGRTSADMSNVAPGPNPLRGQRQQSYQPPARTTQTAAYPSSSSSSSSPQPQQHQRQQQQPTTVGTLCVAPLTVCVARPVPLAGRPSGAPFAYALPTTTATTATTMTSSSLQRLSVVKGSAGPAMTLQQSQALQRQESLLSHRSRGFSSDEAERLHMLRHRESSDKDFGEFLDDNDEGLLDDDEQK